MREKPSCRKPPREKRACQRAWGPRCLALAALLAITVTAAAEAQSQPAAPSVPGASGLPLPRFVSLKSDRVNMRKGPGTDYPTAWVYRRAGLPLEVIKEFEGWRQVRDAYGAAGWVLQSFLSGRRTALVLPWDVKPGAAAPKVALHYDDSERSRPVAMVEAGVIANISSCDGSWCRVSIDKFHGYIEQKKLWGVYPGEAIE
jgi:SH3-like domain-containing protein